MGSQKWADKRFGERVKAERDNRGWSQVEMAKILSDRGIHPMHPTTVAKIEAGDRSVRINEAVGIADLFDISVDALLGRQRPDDSTLTFALAELCSYAGDAERQTLRARNIAADIEDQLESVEERFDLPDIEGLRRVARDMAEQLQAAQSNAKVLVSIATRAIAQAPKKVPKSSPRQRLGENR